MCHQWPCAIACADPIAYYPSTVCEGTYAPLFVVGPRTLRTEWTVSDAHRGKVKKITQVRRHPGMPRVVQPCSVHHQHIGAVRQLPHHLLQHLPFPEVQESGSVRGTCMAMDNPCGSGSAILNYDRGCGGRVTISSGSETATRENNETTGCGESVTLRVPGWWTQPAQGRLGAD